MTDGKKRGFFSSAARFFCHNWGVKLVSLALAILIYYALSPDRRSWHEQDIHDRTLNQY